jgi:hypothetical protein
MLSRPGPPHISAELPEHVIAQFESAEERTPPFWM